MSPSDIVGPSPVTSNGTEITEIEDEATDGIHEVQTEERNDHRRRSEVGDNDVLFPLCTLCVCESRYFCLSVVSNEMLRDADPHAHHQPTRCRQAE